MHFYSFCNDYIRARNADIRGSFFGSFCSRALFTFLLLSIPTRALSPLSLPERGYIKHACPVARYYRRSRLLLWMENWIFKFTLMRRSRKSFCTHKRHIGRLEKKKKNEGYGTPCYYVLLLFYFFFFFIFHIYFFFNRNIFLSYITYIYVNKSAFFFLCFIKNHMKFSVFFIFGKTSILAKDIYKIRALLYSSNRIAVMLYIYIYIFIR